jgi:two-component system OmpR family sensor kinase
MLGTLSLRARLILGVIGVAAVGLVVADVATYSSLKSFLLDRTDKTLEASHPGVERALFPHSDEDEQPNLGLPLGGRIEGVSGSEPGGYIAVLSLAGTVVRSQGIPERPGGPTPSPPRLPATLSIPQRPRAHGERVRYLTVRSKDGESRYRVRASIEPQRPSAILIIAAPLKSVDSTLHRLLLIEILVTAAVLAALALLGSWVVRLGLRPLAAIGNTASKIAAGDLSRRIERADERTEVGRLGLALNAMLAQIEAAFRAREDSEAKLRRFVADASHELRTPLAAVRAYAELFARGAADRPADLERSMTGITRESERMSLLVDDLMLLAHLDEGRPLELAPVRLDEVVAEAIETARTVEPDRPIAVELAPATVLGDRHGLRQVVDNLLANVRSHTPAGAPVRITVEPRDGAVELAVADEGPGLGADQLEHVFERFYRADASRARASGGVGLGLSIVVAVAEAHGGRVCAESPPGHGATFRIALPLADASDSPTG